MNVWGVLVCGVGFMLLYMGIKNVSPGQLVTMFRPQSSTTSSSGSTSTTTQAPAQTTYGPAQ